MGYFLCKSIRLSNTFINFALTINNNLLVRLQMVKDMLAHPSTAPNLTCYAEGHERTGLCF